MRNIFTRSKLTGKKETITEEEFKLLLQRSSEYQIFKAQTDSAAARDLVDEICQRRLFKYGPKNFDSRQLGGKISAVKSYLKMDGIKALNNRANICKLFQLCLNGKMHASMLEPGNLDWPVPRSVGDISSEIQLAITWIRGRSWTASGGDSLSDLEEAMKDVIHNRRDVLSLETLNVLHRSAGKTLSTSRLPHTETFYTGTAAGRSIQRYVSYRAYEMARKGVAPDKWYAVAIFQLLGYIIAHGFGDGNGRTARALFACTQIQNKLPFIAPCYDWTYNQSEKPSATYIAHGSERAINKYMEEEIDKLI